MDNPACAGTLSTSVMPVSTVEHMFSRYYIKMFHCTLVPDTAWILQLPSLMSFRCYCCRFLYLCVRRGESAWLLQVTAMDKLALNPNVVTYISQFL